MQFAAGKGCQIVRLLQRNAKLRLGGRYSSFSAHFVRIIFSSIILAIHHFYQALPNSPFAYGKLLLPYWKTAPTKIRTGAGHTAEGPWLKRKGVLNGLGNFVMD
jgi:hypothetical protein